MDKFRAVNRNFWNLSDEELLSIRLCDLPLKRRNTQIARHLDWVKSRLKKRGLNFQPSFWISTEWFCPDGVVGVAIPFYLLHPRLTCLETLMVGYAEGQGSVAFRHFLVHELGHAFQNAYRLRKRKIVQACFGKSTSPYLNRYHANTKSRSYVHHLPNWYAQSHPDEDFAETFAVTFLSGRHAIHKYKNSRAEKKVLLMQQLFREFESTRSVETCRTPIEPIYDIKMTLGEYYRIKRRRWRLEQSNQWDRFLNQFFVDAEQVSRPVTAPVFLRRIKVRFRMALAKDAGGSTYLVDTLLNNMIQRSRVRGLTLRDSESKTFKRFKTEFAVRTKAFIKSGHHIAER